MAHLLFAEKPGVHGSFHGGWRGPSPTDLLHRPALEFPLADALTVGLIDDVSIATGADQSKQAWWDRALERDDQGAMGACVWFGGFKHPREVLSLKVGHGIQPHSPLWGYRMGQLRYEPASLGQDTGAYVSWAAGIMTGAGAALEADWPYVADPAALLNVPPWIVNARALWYKNVVAVTVPTDLAAMKKVLSGGNGFALGFLVYESFYQAQGTGNVPMPKLDGSDQLLGGHCVYCLGFQDDAAWPGGGYLIWLNQWANFTPRNFLKVPYAMVTAVDPTNGPVVSDSWAFALAPTS